VLRVHCAAAYSWCVSLYAREGDACFACMIW